MLDFDNSSVRCGTCIFWRSVKKHGFVSDENANDVGFCCRFPPKLTTQLGGNAENVWPEPIRDDFCGEHQFIYDMNFPSYRLSDRARSAVEDAIERRNKEIKAMGQKWNLRPLHECTLLVFHSRSTLKRLRGIGKKTLREIAELMLEYGIKW